MMLQPGAEIFHEAMRRNARARELAMLPADWNAERCPKRAGVEVKLDGYGFIWMQGEALTLEGVPFDCASRLLSDVAAIEIALGGDYMLHGEYCEPGGIDAVAASFRRGTSDTGMIYLWDAVPLAAWEGKQHSSPLHERKAILRDAMSFGGYFDAGRVHFLPAAEFDNVHDIEECVGGAWKAGQEGVVVKDLDSPYIRARSPLWMRIKREYTVDCPILDVHTSPTVNVVGRQDEIDVRAPRRLDKLIVDYNGQPVSVPVGYSTAMRSQPHLFQIGGIVEIKHNGETKQGFLKGASFVRLRDDKKGTDR